MAHLDLNKLRGLIAPLMIFAFVTNLAVLVSPIFMMQVLDRVVPSGNSATLLLLLAMALAALVLNGVVSWGQTTSLNRVSAWLQRIALPAVLALPPSQRAERQEDLEVLQNFFGSPQAVALIGLPWLPLFLAALALIHPLYLGLLAAIAGVGLGMQAVVRQAAAHHRSAAGRSHQAEVAARRQLGALQARPTMEHIATNLIARLTQAQGARLTQEEAAERPEVLGQAVTDTLRMAAQILALALGAYLVSQNRLTAGGMIAASIIASKTLITVEQGLGALRHWPRVRQALAGLQGMAPPPATQTEVETLSGALTAAGLIVPRGAGAPPRLDRAGFELAPGDCLAIIGDAAGGKTTLLNALAGVEPAPIGVVSLDQTDVRHLGPAARRAAIGYLPQHASLPPGALGDAISGFDPEATDARILEAAKTARVHGLISALPDGYHTDLDRAPHLLTAGQKQQVALAAALYHKPRYLFLDEPNSLLDRNSERAISEALSTLKADGVTIVMILHRAGIIGLADKVMVMDRGRITDFGPRAEVLGRQHDGQRRLRLPLRQTSLEDLSDWIARQFTRDGDSEFAAKATLLGAELFQAAFLNGPGDTAREVLISFKFLDERNCEVRMIEEGFTQAEEVMVKVNAAVDNGDDEILEFTEAERSLVLAAKLAARLEVSNRNNHATFFAHLQAGEEAGRPERLQ